MGRLGVDPLWVYHDNRERDPRILDRSRRNEPVVNPGRILSAEGAGLRCNSDSWKNWAILFDELAARCADSRCVFHHSHERIRGLRSDESLNERGLRLVYHRSIAGDDPLDE